MTLERRTATEGVELREEGDTLTAVGYAAMFNRLSQNLVGFVERVAPATFRSTLNQSDVRDMRLLGFSIRGLWVRPPGLEPGTCGLRESNHCVGECPSVESSVENRGNVGTPPLRNLLHSARICSLFSRGVERIGKPRGALPPLGCLSAGPLVTGKFHRKIEPESFSTPPEVAAIHRYASDREAVECTAVMGAHGSVP